jgi:hypothetical protein
VNRDTRGYREGLHSSKSRKGQNEVLYKTVRRNPVWCRDDSLRKSYWRRSGRWKSEMRRQKTWQWEILLTMRRHGVGCRLQETPVKVVRVPSNSLIKEYIANHIFSRCYRSESGRWRRVTEPAAGKHIKVAIKGQCETTAQFCRYAMAVPFAVEL